MPNLHLSSSGKVYHDECITHQIVTHFTHFTDHIHSLLINATQFSRMLQNLQIELHNYVALLSLKVKVLLNGIKFLVYASFTEQVRRKYNSSLK